jgi:hypothetical protein
VCAGRQKYIPVSSRLTHDDRPLQIEDTVVNGVDCIPLDEDGKIAEVTVFYGLIPSEGAAQPTR